MTKEQIVTHSLRIAKSCCSILKIECPNVKFTVVSKNTLGYYTKSALVNGEKVHHLVNINVKLHMGKPYSRLRETVQHEIAHYYQTLKQGTTNHGIEFCKMCVWLDKNVINDLL